MQIRGTTILAVRRGGRVVLIGDGQVTMGDAVMKGSARKVRRLSKGRVVAGFAGSTADAFTLFERFEAKLEAHAGNLRRAAVELAKDWRTDRMLRRLEALMIVSDGADVLVLSGAGDVIEPDAVQGDPGAGGDVPAASSADDGVAAIGSGGQYARAAALALLRHTELDAETVAREAMAIAAQICIYSNHHLTTETLEAP